MLGAGGAIVVLVWQMWGGSWCSNGGRLVGKRYRVVQQWWVGDGCTCGEGWWRNVRKSVEKWWRGGRAMVGLVQIRWKIYVEQRLSAWVRMIGSVGHLWRSAGGKMKADYSGEPIILKSFITHSVLLIHCMKTSSASLRT